MSDPELVHVTVEAGVAVLTLDNPPLNLVTLELTRRLRGALDRLAADPAARVLVVTGAGTRAFCAGSDVSEFPSVADDVVRKTASESASVRRMASSSVVSCARSAASLISWSARLGRSASVRASSRAAASAWPGGTTRLTSPQLRAVSASIGSPVNISSLARPSPTRRSTRTGPPLPGSTPSFTSGRASRTSAPATRMSQQTASSSPPP